ncbi:MAG TPA: DMT family transporter [Acidimicrobiales bacterium]|nr:DMT family transporter [Acidimicrobiales bacterium]
MIPALFAAAGAVLIGSGIALQQLVAAEQDEHAVMDPRLVVRLLRRKRWLIGIGLSNLGFACQATAIATGRLVLIEPITATNVLFALLVSSNRTHRRLGPREWRGALAAIVGVGGFLAVANPTEGELGDPAVPWAVVMAAIAVVVVAVTLVARQAAGTRRAVTLAIGGGLAFGVSDAVLKLVTDIGDAEGVDGIVSHWSIWGWMVVSTLAFLLQQSAFHTAHLGASMPATSTLSPVTAAILGAVMFDEQVRGGWWLLPEAVLAGLLVLGVVLLATSPLIEVEPDDLAASPAA